MPAKMRWPQVASPTGFRPGFSRLNSGICGPPHSPSSPGTAPLSSGVTCNRFLLEFSRIETLAGVKRTLYNQYDSLVLPLQTWLAAQGVRLVADCKVTDLDHKTEDGKFIVTGIRCLRRDKSEVITVNDATFLLWQTAAMTDASRLGSMTSAPRKLNKADSGGWALWEKLAEGQPEFGNPAAFNSCIAQSCWESFTVTLKNPAFFDRMTQFSGNQPGTGGLVTFKDSNWLLSIVLAHQPHFRNQPAGVQGVLGILAISGPGRQFRSEADGRVPWRGNSAGTLRSPAIRSGDRCIGQLHSLQNALHHQRVLAPHAATIDRCRCLAARGISRSSASSSKFRMMSSLRWSTRCERPRWPSTSCSISTAKSRP